jgi:hypothetical protein
MKNLLALKILILVLTVFFAIGSANGQVIDPGNPSGREKELALRRKGLNEKKGVGEKKRSTKPVSRKEQEANEKKLKKEYAESVKMNQKRAFDIQTPEVKARMKQNQKEITVREKTRKKKNHSGTKKAEKKYD